MLLTGNLLCRRICKTLSRVCKVPACKIFCMIQCYSLNSCDGPHGAAADKLPAGQLSCSAAKPAQTSAGVSAPFHNCKAWFIRRKNHNDCVFPVLGVSCEVRNASPACASSLPSLADSLQTIKGSREAWRAEWCSHSFIFHFWMLLSPAERGDMSHSEVWAYSGFISSFGWRAEAIPTCAGAGSDQAALLLLPAVRKRVGDGEGGKCVVPGRRKMSPWDAGQVKFAENPSETSLIRLCSCLWNGASTALCGWEAHSYRKGWQDWSQVCRRWFPESICSSLPFFILCINWAGRRRTKSNSTSPNFSQERNSLL